MCKEYICLSVFMLASSAANTHLEVASSTLDPTTHTLTVAVVNQSSKDITAYVIDVSQFDAAGTRLNIPLTVGVDNIGTMIYGENSSTVLHPGAIRREHFGLSPETVTWTAAVVGVAYLDRTAEGDSKQISLLFKNRKMIADHAQAAAALLADYPTTPAEFAARLNKLTSIRERASSVQDLAGSSPPTKEQWAAAAVEQKAIADFLTLHSQEAR